MQNSLFSGLGCRKPSSNRSKFVIGWFVILLAVGSMSVAGCALNTSVGEESPIATTINLPSPTLQDSPIPEPSPTVEDPFPVLAGEMKLSYSFEYLCNPYSVTLPLYQSSYDYFLAKDKRFHYRGSLPDDWQEQFYLNFLAPEEDLDVVNGLINEVRVAIDQRGDDLVMALTSLVQHLTYDCDKLFSYDYLDGEGYQTNFPYETLYTQKGVCGDSSILLGKILRELGYGAALLVFEENNHMALGIQCPLEVATYVEDQIGYCYIETTGPTRIGMKPDTIGGAEFTEDPWIIPISKGNSFAHMTSLAGEMEQDALDYGDIILQLATCQEINLYKEINDRKAVITAHDGRMASLRIKMDQAESAYLEEVEEFNSMGCEGLLPPHLYELCLAQQAVAEERFAAYEELVNTFNQVVGLRNFEVVQMNKAVETFNNLMDAKNESCTVVFSERIEALEAGEELPED